MTTLQKIFVGGALALAAEMGVYEARQAALLRDQNQTLRQQQVPLTELNQELQRQLAIATNRLAGWLAANSGQLSHSNETELLKLRGEVARLREENAKPPTADARRNLLKSWLEREDQLKQVVKQNPDKTIPELGLLSEQDWLNAAKDAKFSSADEVRHTLADLRHSAENTFASLASAAVQKYMGANNGQFPSALSDLLPYFEGSMDAAILERWQILPQSALPQQHMGGDYVITEKGAVDPDLDPRWAIGPGSYGNSSATWDPDLNGAIATMQTVEKAYAAANNDRTPTDPAQIVPYLTTPEQQAAYQKLMQKYGTNSMAH